MLNKVKIFLSISVETFPLELDRERYKVVMV
jgi:hypothetical protein